MKTLNVIQTMSNIARIVCTVLYVCCIIGFCLSLVGLIGLALGTEGVFKLGGVTITGLIEQNADMNRPTMIATTAVAMAFCAAQAVLLKLAQTYFKHELADGTPFTLHGSKEMLRLGIVTAAVSLGLVILCSIAVSMVGHFVPGIGEIPIDEYSSFGFGITLILLSLVCRCGAEQLENQAKTENQSE